MKHGLRIALGALLAGLMLAAQPARAADGPYYITATEVNLRESPNGEIILVFDLNDKVFVVERDGNWSYVSAPVHEQRGWCWTDYLGDERVPVPETGSADEGAVELLKPIEPTELAVEPAPPGAAVEQQAGGDLVVEDTAVAPGDPVAVVDPDQPAGTSLSDVERAAQPPAFELPGGPKADEVCADPQADRLSVFSFGEEPDSGTQPIVVTEDFVPDTGENATADGTSALPGGETSAVEIDRDWRPPATEPTPEELEYPLYQPFVPTARITTPGMLESAFYNPVGGHDLALIRGDNVNVRDGKSLKAEVIGRVDTGDKLYVIGYDDPWYHVSIPARKLKGYVYGEYVDQLPRVEITGDQVRLREAPSLSGRIKTELSRGEVFFEFERRGSWVLAASSASGIKGWVHQDYVASTERSASRPYTVSGDEVNFRASPNVDADILTALPLGTEVQVKGRDRKWSFIEYQGQPGWMYSQYLAPVGRGLVVPQSALGQRLIARARQMQGTPYVWGGESDSGVDCSGLIYKLLLEEGADARGLPRRASTQMAGLGVSVDKEDLSPGDLVFFTTYKAGASHVGIYLGDGDFIHASSAQGKVTISNMSEGYYKRRFVGARRISEAELRGR